jgi:hypothetical protein
MSPEFSQEKYQNVLGELFCPDENKNSRGKKMLSS